MARSKISTAIQIRRARRRLINTLEPRTQLDLFTDRRMLAADALGWLRGGLTTAERLLRELEDRKRG